MYILLFLAQYAIHLYSYLMKWRKNPQWSFSCCLALVLPLTDLQGEISGMVNTNVLDNQLQTGQTDMPTIISTVKDSGAIDVNLVEGRRGDDNITAALHDGRYQDFKRKNKTSDRGTQTELFAIWTS